ncbi:Uncharacterized protein GBIM_20374 [Gryllus bimaculatus]|nr:Uncharacterized protein GBIM_20374 [Gryllus bimaculatus]
MDYDEWTPLGRRDPLKNDPTYDYVPPVLERVHYWIEPSSRTPDPPTLSAQRAEQSPAPRPPNSPTPEAEAAPPDAHDPFLQFVDGPKFASTHQHQFYTAHHHHRPHQHQHPHPHPYPMPLLEGTAIQQKLSPADNSYNNSNGYRQQSASINQLSPSMGVQIYISSEETSTTTAKNMFATNLKDPVRPQQQRPPYTMLIPPPLLPNIYSVSEYQSTADDHSTILPLQMYTPGTSTQPSITQEEANLVFHATMADWKTDKTQLATVAENNDLTLTTSIPVNEVKNPKTPFFTENQVFTNADKTDHDANIGFLHSLLQNEMVPSQQDQHYDHLNTALATTATSTEKTSTSSLLTTDPLFSHYKQPAEPLRGPMYLIIQGHSKVKTYGANKQHSSFHGIPIQVSNEIQHQANEANDTKRIRRELRYTSSDTTKRWLSASI